MIISEGTYAKHFSFKRLNIHLIIIIIIIDFRSIEEEKRPGVAFKSGAPFYLTYRSYEEVNIIIIIIFIIIKTRLLIILSLLSTDDTIHK
mgnify:CR=1 FL=1